VKPATTGLSCAGFLCLRRTKVCAQRDGIDGRLHQVARHVVEQVAAMAETRQKEVSAQE